MSYNDFGRDDHKKPFGFKNNEQRGNAPRPRFQRTTSSNGFQRANNEFGRTSGDAQRPNGGMQRKRISRSFGQQGGFKLIRREKDNPTTSNMRILLSQSA